MLLDTAPHLVAITAQRKPQQAVLNGVQIDALHRKHRGASADRADPGVCERESGGEHGLPRSAIDGAAGEIAERVGRALEPVGLLRRDAESAWLDLPPAEDTDAMRQLLGSSVSYGIAVGPQAGRKALVLRMITALAGEDPRNERVAKANGFSLHAGVSCKAHQRDVRERLCRYIARPAVAEQRLTVNARGKVV